MFYFSPALIIESAAVGVIAGSFLVFAMQLASSLVVGRAFCGWACPGAGLQEPLLAVRDTRLTRGRRDWIKYVIWVPWLAGIAFAAVRAGGYRRVDPFFMTTHGISIAEPGNYVVYHFFVALIVILALVVGRRAFCHYVCWMAPFMVLGRGVRNAMPWPSLRLVARTERCKECLTCTKNCPMSLDVHGMVQRGGVEDAECIPCGTCVDNCSQEALAFSFSAGIRRT
jgi:polyferredoxin